MNNSDLIEKRLKGEISRRDFFKFSGIQLCAYIFGLPLLGKAQKKVTDLIDYRPTKNESFQYDLIYKLFGDFRINTSFIPGTSHYKYPGVFHPDDKKTASVLVNPGLLDFEDYELVSGLIDLDQIKLGGTLIALGSPMSNNLSRLIMGYEQINPKNPEFGMIRNLTKSFFDLPYEYIFDSQKLLKKGLATSRKIDGNDHKVPNWAIKSNIDNSIISADTFDSGNFKNDFLLISVLPNIFETNSYENEDKIVIFGGTHGIATKSIELLFKDEKLLSILSNKVNTPFWQAVIKVDKVGFVEDDVKPISLSRDVEVSSIYCHTKKIERFIKSS